MGDGSASSVTDPAEARKRRKAILTSQRHETDVASGGGSIAESVLPNPSATAIVVGQTAASSSHHHHQAEPDDNGMEKMEKKRRPSSEENDDSCTTSTDEKNGNSHKGKRKTQIRYDPEIPMSKEQLAAWRREARRVRNRESAAASRQRIRNRIDELELEVEDWKTKYNEAVKRLHDLQKASEVSGVKTEQSS